MYDFTSIYNRLRNGSRKWGKMVIENPQLPDTVVPMTVADMDFPTAPEIVKAMQEYVGTEILGYSVPWPSYKQAIIDFMYKHHDYRIEPEWIVPTPGVVSALATAVRMLTKVSEGVLVLTPIYPPFIRVIEEQGRIPIKVELQPCKGEYTIDFDALEALAANENTNVLLLCSPHNPSGRIWTRDELREIGRIAQEYGLYVVSDEIHCDLQWNENRKHMPFPVAVPELADRTIVCTAASKTFNLAGLHCSNIIISNATLREQFIHANEVIGISEVNTMGLVATEAAYTQGEPWMEALKDVLRKNYVLVEQAFSKYGHSFSVMKPDASYLVWVNYEGTGCSYHQFKDILHQANFYINEGIDYGASATYYLRINLGLPTEALQANVDRLCTVLDKTLPL